MKISTHEQAMQDDVRLAIELVESVPDGAFIFMAELDKMIENPRTDLPALVAAISLANAALSVTSGGGAAGCAELIREKSQALLRRAMGIIAALETRPADVVLN